MSKIMGDCLPPEALSQLRSRESTAILATCDPDGRPRTMPLHLMFAPDDRTVLAALRQSHLSVENIRRDGRVSLCLCERGDLNISISGRAKIVRERALANGRMCLVEIRIDAVKDDSTHSETVSGIRYRCRSEAGERFIRDMLDELEGFGKP